MEDKSWLVAMFSNPIADAILIVGAIAIVIILGILGKKGLLKVSLKGISLGNGELERTIVRGQIDYCKAAVDTFVESLEKEESTKWRRRYIGELVFDIFISCISYNHITKTSFYIDNKIEQIWAVIVKYVSDEERDKFINDDFKNKVSREVREVFEHLVDLREYYNKEEK